VGLRAPQVQADAGEGSAANAIVAISAAIAVFIVALIVCSD
jgi:hypothetical protein